MSEFTTDGKKLTAAHDVDGELGLRGKDLVKISDLVLSFTEKSNVNSSQYPSELVKELKEDIDRKNEEIMLNHKTISKLRRSLANLQKQLFQLEPKSVGTATPDKENGNLFFLIKKNLGKIERDLDYFPYYALRAKNRFAKESLDHLKSKYPLSEVIFQVEDPPEVDLFNSLTELKNIKSCENHLETSLTEEELISIFENLKYSKQYQI